MRQLRPRKLPRQRSRSEALALKSWPAHSRRFRALEVLRPLRARVLCRFDQVRASHPRLARYLPATSFLARKFPTTQFPMRRRLPISTSQRDLLGTPVAASRFFPERPVSDVIPSPGILRQWVCWDQILRTSDRAPPLQRANTRTPLRILLSGSRTRAK